MSTVKKTVSIDESVAKEASTISENFSAIVETALIEYIQQYRTHKAIQSFGKWAERKETSVDIVNQLRQRDDRAVVTSTPIKKRKKDRK